MLRTAISAALQEAGLPALPASTTEYRQMVEDYRWALQNPTQIDKHPPGSPAHTAIIALLTFHYNTHVANHTHSCGKKKSGVCRFRLPHLHHALSAVLREKSDNDTDPASIELLMKRGPANIYTAQFNKYLSAIFLSNTNIQVCVVFVFCQVCICVCVLSASNASGFLDLAVYSQSAFGFLHQLLHEQTLRLEQRSTCKR
jgi:hypothetical protein